VGLPADIFSSSFLTAIVCAFLNLAMRTDFLFDLILFDLNIPTPMGKEEIL
jgi:hypothetical protein